MQVRFDQQGEALTIPAPPPPPAPRRSRAAIHRDRLIDLVEENRIKAQALDNAGDWEGYHKHLDLMFRVYKLMCTWSPETREEVVGLLKRVVVELPKRAEDVKAWENRLARMVGPTERTESTVMQKGVEYDRLRDQKRILIWAITDKEGV